MFYSTYEDVDVPHSDLISFILEPSWSYDQKKPIFVDANDTDRSYSIKSLRRDAQCFATSLASRFDFNKGDVVAVFSANSIEYPMVVFGSFYVEGVVTLISPVYRELEVAHQLRDAAAKVIYTTEELLPVARAACKLVGLPDSSIIIAGEHEGTTPLATMLASEPRTKGRKPDGDDLAFLCYSSGTTGLSKGVKLTHVNLVANLLQWDAGETRLDHTCSVVSALPFSHIYALNVLILNPMRRLMTSYVMPRFHPGKFLQLVQAHKITASFIVPPIVKALLSPVAAEFDLSSLNFLCSGAAPLSPDMAQELCARYDLAISQGFGLTETSPVLCYGRFEAAGYSGSVGKLLPNIELRIVGEDGTERPYGGHGELQVRGPNVMQGYLNNDLANSIAFTDDGFFKTGDLGYVAENGNVYLVDRIKELIKYKGFQVPPVELENLLITHPAVQDCAVVGRNCDIEVTELPTAFCVLKPEALSLVTVTALPVGWTEVEEEQRLEQQKKMLAQELIKFVAAKVAPYKKLRGGVVFVNDIPRAPAGKILRRILREKKDVKFLV